MSRYTLAFYNMVVDCRPLSNALLANVTLCALLACTTLEQLCCSIAYSQTEAAVPCTDMRLRPQERPTVKGRKSAIAWFHLQLDADAHCEAEPHVKVPGGSPSIALLVQRVSAGMAAAICRSRQTCCCGLPPNIMCVQKQHCRPYAGAVGSCSVNKLAS